MLAERNTPKFLYGSLQLFGGVDDHLMRLADGLTAAIAPHEDRDRTAEGWADAQALATRASQEIETYRKRLPAFTAEVAIRPDVAGVLVSRGTLLIEATARFPRSRLDAIAFASWSSPIDRCATTTVTSSMSRRLL